MFPLPRRTTFLLLVGTFLLQSWLVYADPARSVDEIRKHQDAYEFGCPVLRDPEQGLARFTGARVTPEAIVYDAAKTRVYRGRINDQYVDFGKTRPAPRVPSLFTGKAFQSAASGSDCAT